ncbi:MAG: hypothetical protein ACKVRN_13490 [Pyrinomonadaceae bacterium]
MKICPKCQKTYADDNLNFCLEDGSVLSAASAPLMPETVVMNEPRITQPQSQAPPPPSQPGWQPPPTQPQQYSMQPPKKSSKTWIWVVAILGILLVLCGGGGIFSYFVFKAAQDDINSTLANTDTTRSTSTPPGTKSTTNDSRDYVVKVDLNMFVKEFSVYGTTEMNGSELTMGSKQKGFYYVLVAPEEFTTEDADTRVTLRNIDDANSSLGYGLIFHSNPQPLQKDYAFLIDTKRKKYEVVYHEPQKETVVKKWTASSAINGGTEANTLEVRDQNDKIDFYINGTLVTSIKNEHGYPGGVVGLYSGDGVKIAFKDLEIRR